MKIKLPKNKWIIWGVIGIIAVVGGLLAYKTLSAKPVTPTTVTRNVGRGDVKKVISATGTVSYPTVVNLTFANAEKLIAKNVEVGDSVKAGQVLMQIDTSNLQQTVNQQQAALASAQAKLKQAEEKSLRKRVFSRHRLNWKQRKPI